MTLRSFFLPLFFGTLVGLAAAGRSGPAAGILAGLLSFLGFFFGGKLARGRVLKRQGPPPSMRPGEQALLHGPGEVADARGSAPAWIYLSNQRLTLQEQGADAGAGTDIALSRIEELRPARQGWFGGEVVLVAAGQGMITLKVSDARRWHGALKAALQSS